jgi:hypothetical protein
MSLIAGQLSKNMQNFIKEVNKMKQDDADKAIKAYCDELELLIDKRIKSITITIPAGAIQVQGSPSAQMNILPIALNKVVS